MDLREMCVLCMDMCWGPSQNLEYDTGKSKFHGKNHLIDWFVHGWIFAYVSLPGGLIKMRGPISRWIGAAGGLCSPGGWCVQFLCGTLAPKLYRVLSSTRIHQHTEMSKWMFQPCFEILPEYAWITLNHFLLRCLWVVSKSWCPSSFAKLVQITPTTWVYSWYIELLLGGLQTHKHHGVDATSRPLLASCHGVEGTTFAGRFQHAGGQRRQQTSIQWLGLEGCLGWEWWTQPVKERRLNHQQWSFNLIERDDGNVVPKKTHEQLGVNWSWGSSLSVALKIKSSTFHGG